MSHDPLRPSPDPAPMNSPHEIVPVQEKDKTRATWKADERHVLPENRFWIVIPGLMCCIFLAALDQVRSQLLPLYHPVCSLQQTIVATALPTIVQHLGGGKNYSWVGRYSTSLVRCLV
jgi:hypothetical protein